MSPSQRDADRLAEMREATQRILAYTYGLSYDAFREDRKTQDAIVHNLHVLGETTKQLSAALTQQYPALPWRGLAALRSKLAHRDLGINYDVVWAAATVDLPTLLPYLDALAASLAAPDDAAEPDS